MEDFCGGGSDSLSVTLQQLSISITKEKFEKLLLQSDYEGIVLR